MVFILKGDLENHMPDSLSRIRSAFSLSNLRRWIAFLRPTAWAIIATVGPLSFRFILLFFRFFSVCGVGFRFGFSFRQRWQPRAPIGRLMTLASSSELLMKAAGSVSDLDLSYGCCRLWSELSPVLRNDWVLVLMGLQLRMRSQRWLIGCSPVVHD